MYCKWCLLKLHYIDYNFLDIVGLQGTLVPPHIWEKELRDDLIIANHSASLISLTPAEHVAIVADMEKWSVRLITPRCSTFPDNLDGNIPMGMSQLVSSMLETVHVMYKCGISANKVNNIELVTCTNK